MKLTRGDAILAAAACHALGGEFPVRWWAPLDEDTAMVGYEDADGTFHEATADWKWAEANYAAFLEK